MLCFVFSVASSSAYGQSFCPGARGAALGGATVALDDACSSLQNVAASAFRSGFDAAVAYRHDFLLSALSHKYLALSSSLSATGTAMASYQHYGNRQYNEQSLQLAYAQAVSRTLSFGVALHYLYSGTNSPYYDAVRGATASVSCYYALTPKVSFGAMVYNPFLIRLDSYSGDRLPSLLAFGVAYKPLTSLTAVLQIDKDYYQPLALRMGVEYSYASKLAIRAGVITQPVVFSFGMGYNSDTFSFDFAALLHQTLGFTPQLSLVFSF